MKWIAICMMTVGFLTLLGASVSRLSSDAIGMALGMILGVLSGLPTAALVIIALRSSGSAPTNHIEILPPQTPTYADQVTPYTHAFRRVAEMPALPNRKAQIAELHSYLAVLEAEKVR
jgi:hypothetical protein